MKSKEIILGILAHVDSGKTTLAEGILFETGTIRQCGRVDHKNTFLDTDSQERQRGITIFSKQAKFSYDKRKYTLLDTPGHVDFSTEMERTLQVLDYAILIISGVDGIQAHTRTLWALLEHYNIPTFIFINKMDQIGADKDKIENELKRSLNKNCIEFSRSIEDENFKEEIAVVNEELLSHFLDTGKLEMEEVKEAFMNRKFFPVIFGSALKNEGIKELLQVIDMLSKEKEYSEVFGARVYKITRDNQNNRLTHLKITGGKLRVRDIVENKSVGWNEKINQIRQYSGEQYESCDEITAGSICTVLGLTKTYVGECLGIETESKKSILKPIMTFKVEFEGIDNFYMYNRIKVLEEEDPALHIIWNEKVKEIQMQMMGEIQIEIIKRIISDRFEIEPIISEGSIIYKETIKKTSIGIGHFEPLRHYAEVHIQIDPLEQGNGIEYESNVSEDILAKNWQRLILTNMKEKKHVGVLTGSDITDVKFSVINGRAHIKHTEGGDFRQATYRAIRQGLMYAESVLLEPYYEYSIQIPQEYVGRAMKDISDMYGTINEPEISGEYALLTGKCPVSTMKNYSKDILAYSHGTGQINVRVMGYYECHNQQEVIEKLNYNPENDIDNTPDSVFCAHGAGFVVPWYEVGKWAHLDDEEENKLSEVNVEIHKSSYVDDFIDQEEIDEIMNRTYGVRQEKKVKWKKTINCDNYSDGNKIVNAKNKFKKKDILLVDGYNIIFAWDELKDLSMVSIDAARDKLLDELCDFQGYSKIDVVVVFDAYKVSGGKGLIFEYKNLHVVYTKEAQTADSYIEKTVHELTKDNNVIVATSDRLEQMIIWGAGARRLSANGLKEMINSTHKIIIKEIKDNNQNNRMQSELSEKIEEARKKGMLE